MEKMSRSDKLPSTEEWHRLAEFLDALETVFAPKLKTIAGLRAIRFGELEVLQSHSRDLPESCRVVSELYAASNVILYTLKASLDLEDVTAVRKATADVEKVLCSRILTCLRSIEDELRDLATFVPLWQNSIVRRRALMLRPKDGEEDDMGAEERS
jgi:hypothetical protein